MRDFRAIIAVLKEHLQQGKNQKVFDKDVAQTLQMTQSRFATSKRRNTIPYEEILFFCHREALCCSEIFFNTREKIA